MNIVQTKHQRMFLNTQTSLNNNTSLWNTIPILVSMKNDLDELIQRIEAQNEKTNPGSVEITANKEEVKNGLAQKAMSLSGTLQAYAAINNLPEITAKVKLTKTDISRARETDIEALVKPLIDIARENLDQLVDFVVTEEIVSELETSLDDFKVLIGQPRVIRNQAFAAMDKLDELFDATNKLLKEKLDKIMIRFEYSDTEFYQEYIRARTIVG